MAVKDQNTTKYGINIDGTGSGEKPYKMGFFTSAIIDVGRNTAQFTKQLLYENKQNQQLSKNFLAYLVIFNYCKTINQLHYPPTLFGLRKLQNAHLLQVS